MYDFLRPAAQNRPTNASFPPDIEDGIPVYPVLSTNEEAVRSNIGRPDTDAYHAGAIQMVGWFSAGTVRNTPW
jgi:hypothetical protein